MIRTLFCAVATLCLTAACSSSPSRSNVFVAPQATAGGPPAHAPAHGYRHNNKHKQRYKGIDLVFDTGLGVYVVVDMDEYFFDSGSFYRYRDNNWEVSIDIDRGWTIVASNKIPHGLLANHHGHGKHKGKGKKHKG